MNVNLLLAPRGNLSISVIASHVRKGEISAVEVADFFLRRIRHYDSQLNCFLDVDHDFTLRQAVAVDKRRLQGASLGPLAGVPIAIKDGICTRGMKTTAGSRMLKNFQSPYDATVVQRLRNADAVILGKTNMDEFAMGGSTESSAFGVTRNPWSFDAVPGGSSGGSAAAVAAWLAPAALGSDTGGSIRQPAAFCGITGLKPTYGRVSRYGLIAFASSLDQIGPLTRTAADARQIMKVIAGHDPRDSTSLKIPYGIGEESGEPDSKSQEPLIGNLSGLQDLKLGVCRSHWEQGLNSEISAGLEQAIELLKRLGCSIVDIELPHSQFAVPCYYVVAPCEASSNLARYDGVRYTGRQPADDLQEMYCRTRSELFGAEVQRRIMLGTFALSSGYYDAYYLQASKVRRLIKQDYDRAFTSCDLIIGPSTPTTAFPLGSRNQDPLEMYLADVYTVAANLAGIPAISIPAGFDSSGLPIGLQLQGPHFGEDRLLQVSHQFQQHSEWHRQWPSRFAPDFTQLGDADGTRRPTATEPDRRGDD